MVGPTIPPPTALFGEAVLFLNHCGCAGWSAHLLFANFSHIEAHIMFSVLKCSCTQFRTQIVDKHVLHSEMKNLFLDFNYSNLNYLYNINEIGYPLRPLSSAHKTIQQILYSQCQTNTIDTRTQIQ